MHLITAYWVKIARFDEVSSKCVLATVTIPESEGGGTHFCRVVTIILGAQRFKRLDVLTGESRYGDLWYHLQLHLIQSACHHKWRADVDL